MFTLRPALPRDASVLLDLVKGLAAYERAPDAVVATEEDFERALSSDPPEMHAVLAEEDGHAIGFALWFATWSTWRGRPGIHLEDLFVLPDRRGRGIGKALLSHVAREAVRRRCARLEWQVLDWNEPALAFYRSLGAATLSEWVPMRVEGEALRILAG